MNHQVTCKEFVNFLDDYLSGELAAARRDEFNTHLSICPSCVAYMKTYEEAIRMGKAVLKRTDDPVPAEVPEGLLRAILAARKKDA